MSQGRLPLGDLTLILFLFSTNTGFISRTGCTTVRSFKGMIDNLPLNISKTRETRLSCGPRVTFAV